MMFTAKNTFAFAAVLSVLTLVAAVASAADEVNTDRTGLALGGYDPVSYFAVGKPTKGNFQITAEHEGATYRFASKSNRDLFARSPGRYAPQYGGYCAYGVAKNAKFSADPTVWKIVDGKLFVNLDQDIAALFEKDVPGHISKANKNWSGLRSKSAH